MLPLVTVLVLSGCLAVGVALGLLASLKLQAARHPERAGYSFVTLLTAFDFAFIGLLLVASFPVDFWGVQKGVIGGSILLGLGLIGLALVPLSQRAYPPLALAGLGAAGLYLSLLQLMPNGLLGDREVAASLLFGTVFVGLGALLARPLFDVLTGVLGYRVGMLWLGAACFAPAILAALVAHDSFPPQPAFAPLAVATNPKVWIAGLVFAFYAPLEAFVSVWVTTYLTTHERPAASGAVATAPAPPSRDASDQAAAWIAWFWLAFLGSRVLVGILQHFSARDDYQAAFLVIPALLSAVVLGNLSGSTHTRQALSGVIVLGFVLGPVFPILLAFVATMQQEVGGHALSLALLHVGGAAGGVLLSPLVNLSAEGRTAQTALRLPLFLALLLSAATLVFALTAER